MPHAPRVSVVMPIHDAEMFLAGAIESMLEQTFQDLELIAVDDGSTDGSSGILEGFARLDPRVRVVTNETNLGLTDALNRGWRLARAPYVARMDADDIAYPDRLSKQVAFLDAHPGVAAVGGTAIAIDPAGRQIYVMKPPMSSSAIRARLRRRNCFIHAAVTMRRTALEAVGGYRFDPGAGYDLWLRLSERYDLANLSDPVILYRVYAGQMSIAALDEATVNTLAIQAAARSRAASGNDPLSGVHELSRTVLLELGVGEAVIDRALAVAWLSMASTLVDTGRQGEADQLLASVSRTLGSRTRRAFAATREIKKAGQLLSAGRPYASAAHVLAAVRCDARYTTGRVVAALGDRVRLPQPPRLRGSSRHVRPTAPPPA